MIDMGKIILFFKRGKPLSDEKGIALLITLGILSMLLMLAMAFSSSARVTLQAAQNSNDVAVARILADSAVQRVIGAMKFYSSTSPFQYSSVKSHDETDSVVANRKNFDLLNRLDTVTADVEYDWPASYNPDAANAVHWQYVYNGLTGSGKRIIGRVAYVTVPMDGKLDPSACVDTGGSPVNENGANEVRNGVNVREINIQNLSPTFTNLTATNVSNFSSATCATPGKLISGQRWTDWDALFSSSKLNITTTTQRQQFRDWMNIYNYPDPEAFWSDTNSNGIVDSGELFHRFNLARTDWNSLTVANIAADPIAYTVSPSTYDGNGIEWINNWTGGAGTYSSVTARKNQIAANLLDYCDSNDDVTTDNSASPTYTGNEKTPYINELGIRIQCTVALTVVTATTKRADMRFYIQPGVELINMFGATFSAASSFNIQGNVYFTCRTAAPVQSVAPGNMAFNLTFTPTALGASAYRLTWSATNTNFYTWSPVINNGTAVYCENLKVQITKASLTYNTKFADYAAPDTSSDWSTIFATFNRTTAGTTTSYFGYKIDDPRQNLNPADWGQGIYNTSIVLAGITASAVNSGVTCTTAADGEAGSIPTTVSTNYIRNASMQSPWELGFIHRGGLWETLNLHVYNTTQGVLSTAGGGTYAAGDANILDQVKMTSDVKTYGKVSVNSSNLDVLKALFANIRVGVDLKTAASPGDLTKGTALTYGTNVANIATAITSSTFRPFKTRAELVKVVKLKDGTEATQTKKATKDEIIGKMINLTKAYPAQDTIVIIALAQTVKDVGDGVTINKDLNGDGTIANINEATTGIDFNGDGDSTDSAVSETMANCQYGTYNMFADEILAEQKLIAIVCRNPVNGKWNIKKIMYLED